MDKRKWAICALPVVLVILALAGLGLVRKGTGDTRVITVKVLYDHQVEKAYELNTPEKNLADALLEVPDGQDFTSVVEVYVNGVRTETPLKELAVEDGDLFEFVYAASQIEGN
ncbi:MAG: hypothetical protein HFJ10_00130 [Lachnospiraceae bacterium]|jgi:hypothetical protein|nr:hypothetical protein [Lachnospiraceae bacterium]